MNNIIYDQNNDISSTFDFHIFFISLYSIIQTSCTVHPSAQLDTTKKLHIEIKWKGNIKKGIENYATMK